jgi:hypothetical protein
MMRAAQLARAKGRRADPRTQGTAGAPVQAGQWAAAVRALVETAARAPEVVAARELLRQLVAAARAEAAAARAAVARPVRAGRAAQVALKTP